MGRRVKTSLKAPAGEATETGVKRRPDGPPGYVSVTLKRLGILLLPPSLDGMLVHPKVTPQHYDRRYPFIHLGEERQCEIKFLI